MITDTVTAGAGPRPVGHLTGARTRSAAGRLPTPRQRRWTVRSRKWAAQILLDRSLVLRGRRHQTRVGERAVRIEGVAVVQQPARRLRGTVAGGTTRGHRDMGPGRRGIGVDEAQRLIVRVVVEGAPQPFGQRPQLGDGRGPAPCANAAPSGRWPSRSTAGPLSARPHLRGRQAWRPVEGRPGMPVAGERGRLPEEGAGLLTGGLLAAEVVVDDGAVEVGVGARPVAHEFAAERE